MGKSHLQKRLEKRWLASHPLVRLLRTSVGPEFQGDLANCPLAPYLGEAGLSEAELQRLVDEKKWPISPSEITEFLKEYGDDPSTLSVAELSWLLKQSQSSAKRGRDDSTPTELSSTELYMFYSSLFKDDRHSGFSSEEFVAFGDALQVPLPMCLRLHTSPVRRTVYNVVRDTFPLATLSFVKEEAQNDIAAFSCSDQEYHGTQGLEDRCRTLHSGGLLSFQEGVSMLPVLALQPTPNDRVLDLCAAPGSKTLHALDLCLRDGWEAAGKSVLVANEKDRIKATHTLPARMKRYGAPNVIITQSDATLFPRLNGMTTRQAFLFDKVICDVPCSGDGTLRKDRSVAKTWTPRYVETLTGTQRSILKRAVQSLAPGGTVVYSTCSMNPAEDEEVVASILEEFGDALSLLNVHQALMSQGIQLNSRGGTLVPTIREDLREAIAANVLRVFPHRNNTGGFFLALLRKQSHASIPPPVSTKLSHWSGIKRLQTIAYQNDEEWKSIRSFFGLSQDSLGPFEVVKHLTPSRKVNRMFLMTKAVFELLFGYELHKSSGVEAVTAGARLVEKLDSGFLAQAKCRWRPVCESADWFGKRATKRRISLHTVLEESMCSKLLRESSLPIEDVKEKLAECRDDQGEIETGGVLLQMKLEDGSSWWLTGNLHTHRLELTADSSIRRCFLLTVFGEQLPFDKEAPAEER